MKLKQIVYDESELTLSKEKKQIIFGEVFEIEDEERVKEILAATYHGKPVAELIEEDEQQDEQQEEEQQEEEQPKAKGKKSNSKK